MNNIWFPQIKTEEEEKPKGYWLGHYQGYRQQRRNHNFLKTRPEYAAYQEGYKDGLKKFIEEYKKKHGRKPRKILG